MLLNIDHVISFNTIKLWCGFTLFVHAVTQFIFVQALCNAEDETDVQAAKVVAAEQKAELAEFDENIPWDEKEEASRREEDDVSKVEQELAMLEKEVSEKLIVLSSFSQGMETILISPFLIPRRLRYYF